MEHPPAPLVTSHLDKTTTALSCSFLAKTQLLRDSSWLRTQMLGTYERTDDPQWRRSCSCDGGGSVARGGQYSGACVVGTFLWRTYPTYRQYSGACVVHTLIVSSGAGGPTVATERGVGAKIRLKVFSITSQDSSFC